MPKPLKTFRGGVHPEESKKYTRDKPIERMPVPQRLVIPMAQHIGAPGVPVVQIGDTVKKGQLIGENDAFISGSVHASTSGKVIDIGV